MDENEFRVKLEQKLPELTDRQRKVIIRRFGLKGFQPMTAEQVGNDFTVSAARIDEIVEKALRQLGLDR